MELTNIILRIMQVLLMYLLWTYREEILLSVIAWMTLEGTMLCKLSQIKTNAIWAHLNEESKTNNHTEQNINPEQFGGFQRQGLGGGAWMCEVDRDFPL